VQRVEAGERIAPDLGAAAQERRKEGSEEGRRPVDVDADDGRPVRGLVVREQVPGEALEQRRRKEQRADYPVQLTRVLVGAEQEDARHVEEHQDDEDARAPPVHAADEPAERHVVRDVLDGLVGSVRVRLVVHREDHAGAELDEEGGERRGAQRVPPA
jgi:hypothetical protein